MVAVFVHGCLWHFREPRHNRKWWREKIARNKARDRGKSAALRRRGWRVMTIWEHVDPRLRLSESAPSRLWIDPEHNGRDQRCIVTKRRGVMSVVEVAVALSYVRRRQISSHSNGAAGQSPQADCPAASAALAQAVIGARRAGSETVDFLPRPVGFPRVLRELKEDVVIERELRMVGPCVKTACPHWFGSCVLGHAVADVASSHDVGAGCSIVARCRWRLENGPEVCGPCASILNVEMKEFINGAVS